MTTAKRMLNYAEVECIGKLLESLAAEHDGHCQPSPITGRPMLPLTPDALVDKCCLALKELREASPGKTSGEAVTELNVKRVLKIKGLACLPKPRKTRGKQRGSRQWEDRTRVVAIALLELLELMDMDCLNAETEAALRAVACRKSPAQARQQVLSGMDDVQEHGSNGTH